CAWLLEGWSGVLAAFWGNFSSMNTLQATFRIVTPMFMSGADQKKAELPGPSIKAALRFLVPGDRSGRRNLRAEPANSKGCAKIQPIRICLIDDWNGKRKFTTCPNLINVTIRFSRSAGIHP
ncbi:MAG: hypothetical protein ACREVA_07780, partial [Burkholderiales bacterium]